MTEARDFPPSGGGAFPPVSVAEILEAVQALDAAASADAWDEALEIEAHCRELLEALLAGPVDAERADAIANIALIYQRVIRVAEGCRSAVAEELARLRRGRHGTRAYDAESGA